MTALLLVVGMTASGCAEGMQAQSPTPAGTAAVSTQAVQARQETEAERLLEQRSAAMQRTMLEATGAGTALGMGLGGGFGLRGLIVGAVAGAAAGAAAGSYVGMLQQEYENDERRLERVVADLDRSNAEAEAVIEAMRAVLEQQRAEIASIRAAIAQDRNAQALLTAELESLQENVAEMQGAISGADQRLADARQARGILDTGQAAAEVDPRLGELSRRIAAMREIATTLAQEA